MPARRSYISPSTNPASAPFCGPAPAPAAAASASTTCTVTPAGRRSTNSVCWSATSTTPDEAPAGATGPGRTRRTRSAQLESGPVTRRPRSGLYRITCDEVEVVEIGERLRPHDQSLATATPGDHLDHVADRERRRGARLSLPPAVEHDVADLGRAEARRVGDELDLGRASGAAGRRAGRSRGADRRHVVVVADGTCRSAGERSPAGPSSSPSSRSSWRGGRSTPVGGAAPGATVVVVVAGRRRGDVELRLGQLARRGRS